MEALLGLGLLLLAGGRKGGKSDGAPRESRKLTPYQAALRLKRCMDHYWGRGRDCPRAKVRRYQRAMQNIAADGIVGPETRLRAEALEVELPPPPQERGHA